MVKRKIAIQRDLGVRPTAEKSTRQVIDDLTSGMATVDVGFEPTDQRVYNINLARIFPDPTQPRHFLPHDLRVAVHTQSIAPADALRQLIKRVENGDTVAQLVLGSVEDTPIDDEDAEVDEKSLYALARSILEVGLRQPINVYQISDPQRSDHLAYRIGEGERRFWAHHLLVLQGHTDFAAIKAIVDTLPDDKELIYQRQAAENAARVDLPAMARARSMLRIKERLLSTAGTPVPTQRELQSMIGQEVKKLTGRAVGDRMVRNYLILLNLSPEAQDLAEAGQLTEKQLRPVMRLKTDFERLMMIKDIIKKSLSSREIVEKITKKATQPKVTLREVTQVSVEERFEKRVMSAAKTMASLVSDADENYETMLDNLALRARDTKTREVLESLHQALGDILRKAESLAETKHIEIGLNAINPPIELLQPHLPPDKFVAFMTDALSGQQIMEQLLAWQQHDVLIASRLHHFMAELETQADILRAQDDAVVPVVSLMSGITPRYEVREGAIIYWAHELLVQRGLPQFRVMAAALLTH